MTKNKEFKFYELSAIPLEKALPQLAYKIYDKLNENIFLLLRSEEEVALFDRLLWSFSSNKFLPHGTVNDKKEYFQKLLISAKNENLNKAKILISNSVVNDKDFISEFSQIIYIFSDNKLFLDEYKNLKSNQINANYWQQSSDGKWQANG